MFKAMNVPDNVRRAYMKGITGKTSAKDFTADDFDKVFNEIGTYLNKALIARTGDPSKVRATGWFESNIKPYDRLLFTSHARDLTAVDQLHTAKALQIVELRLANDASMGLQHRWGNEFYKAYPKLKGNIGQRIKGTVFGKTDIAGLELNHRLQYNPNDPRTVKPTTKLTPELKKIYKDYRRITDIYWMRLNEIRKVAGKDELPYNEFYMYHNIDRAAMKRAGRASEIPRTEYSKVAFTEPKIPIVEKVSTEFARTQHDFPLKNDPFQALRSMVRHDLKAIYLREPSRIVRSHLQELVKAKLIDNKTAEQMYKPMRWVIWEQPTPGVEKLNNTIKNLMDKKLFGKSIDTLVASFNKTVGENPARVLSNLWGKTVATGYIGGRARLAIRNSLQPVYNHGYVDLGSLAKAMVSGDPTHVKEWKTTNPFWKMTVGQAGEEHVMTQKTAGKLLFGMFQKSHINNVDISVRAAYYQVMDYITKPKYKKLGWWDDEGVKLRKTNPTAVSHWEKANMFKEMEFQASHTQFLYNVLGMPLIARGAAAPFFKLTSYPMNYGYKYLASLGSRMKTGRPEWAGEGGPKLPWNNRFGLIKHFVFLGAALSAVERAGLDYSSLLGFGYTPEKGVIRPWGSSGVFNMRPSPLMNMLMTMKDKFSDDPYIRKKASFMRTVPIPGKLAVTDILKAVETGERKKYLFHTPYVRKKRKKTRIYPAPFKPVTTMRPFQ
jgi:hypothetical protein